MPEFDTDFSRVKELFYSPIDPLLEISIDSFIADAFSKYKDKCLAHGRKRSTQKVIFPGSSDASLSLVIAPYRNIAAVTKINMSGKTERIDDLIDSIDGSFTAEFSSISEDSVKEPLRTKIASSRQGNHSQVGLFSFYFSRNPEKSGQIKKIIYSHEPGKKQAMIKGKTLRDYSKELLASAEHIAITNSSYDRNDQDKELYHESCNIYQPEEKEFSLDYISSSAAGKPLPDSAFTNIMKIFNIIKPQFSQKSFLNAAMKPNSGGSR